LPKNDDLDAVNEVNEVNEVILLALSGESSVWLMAGRMCVPKSTVDRRLVDSLHFPARYLHWIPH
jgi:hypothetical protein